MQNSRDDEANGGEREAAAGAAALRHTDLPDSPHDAERLKGDEAILDLPDVADIPGQEFVHVAPLGELADTTISSADEEGDGLFDDDAAGDDDEVISGTEAPSSK